MTKALTKVTKPGAIKPLEPWEEEAMAQASTERAQEALGVPRITTRGQQLQVDGKPVANNRLKLAIVDYVFEKRYNKDKFDPKDTRPPDCYAQARPMPGEKAGDTEGRMIPHTAAPDKQSAQCKGCPHNAFGTARFGRGKACKDYRKLLVFSPRIGPDGSPEVDEDAVAKGALYQIDVPPASLKEWGAFYNGLGSLTRTGNIREAIVEVTAEPLPNSGGHKVVFSFVRAVEHAGFKAIWDLGKAKGDLLMQPWPVREREEKKEPERPLKGQGKKR